MDADFDLQSIFIASTDLGAQATLSPWRLDFCSVFSILYMLRKPCNTEYVFTRNSLAKFLNVSLNKNVFDIS